MSRKWRATDSTIRRSEAETTISNSELMFFLSQFGAISVPPIRPIQVDHPLIDTTKGVSWKEEKRKRFCVRTERDFIPIAASHTCVCVSQAPCTKDEERDPWNSYAAGRGGHLHRYHGSHLSCPASLPVSLLSFRLSLLPFPPLSPF